MDTLESTDSPVESPLPQVALIWKSVSEAKKVSLTRECLGWRSADVAENEEATDTEDALVLDAASALKQAPSISYAT